MSFLLEGGGEEATIRPYKIFKLSVGESPLLPLYLNTLNVIPSPTQTGRGISLFDKDVYIEQ